MQEQRLIGLFDRLMERCEAMTAVADFTAVEKQARALSAVRRTLKDIYHKESDSGETGMYDDDHAGADTIEARKLRLERKLDRLAEAAAAQGLDKPAQSDEPEGHRD